MRRRRHSSESAAPVETAMFGMSPSDVVVRHPELLPREGRGVVLDALGDVRERVLHPPLADLDDERNVGLPTGMFVIVKLPPASVTALTTGDVYQVEQLPQVDALRERLRIVFGTYTDDVVERDLASRVVNGARQRRGLAGSAAHLLALEVSAGGARLDRVPSSPPAPETHHAAAAALPLPPPSPLSAAALIRLGRTSGAGRQRR